uniref:Uncharacterized protein n=1 Tax=Arundo donax TaxID=35708 RepID=A0A0A9HR89_ARUDO
MVKLLYSVLISLHYLFCSIGEFFRSILDCGGSFLDLCLSSGICKVQLGNNDTK